MKVGHTSSWLGLFGGSFVVVFLVLVGFCFVFLMLKEFSCRETL